MNKIIIVVLCDVLGYSKECFVLKELADLNSVVMCNPKYENALLEDEELGCVIADDIKQTFDLTHDKDIWMQFYKMFLSEIASLVASSQYDEAITKYQHMILVLKEYFGIDSLNCTDRKVMIKKDSCFC